MSTGAPIPAIFSTSRSRRARCRRSWRPIRSRYLWLKDSQYKEVASNLDGEYRDKSCCILGLRGSLVRDEPQVARAITQALLDAAMFTAQNPDKAAKSFQPYAPKAATLADLEAMARYHTHHHHPVGDVLKRELKGYADDLKSGFGLQAQHRYGQIRGEDLCRRIRCLTAIAVEGSRASSSRAEAIGDWLKGSGIGVAAAVAWIAFGLSCLWWPDLGDWSRTYALGIAAFVVAAFALFGTLSADFLGLAGPALRQPRAVACRARRCS